MTPTTTQTAAPAADASEKTKAPAAPRTWVGEANEAAIHAMRSEVKAPKTELGRFALKTETAIRRIQDILNEHGNEVVLEELLGHKRSIPIKLGIQVGLKLQVGDAPEKVYIVELTPNPANAP